MLSHKNLIASFFDDDGESFDEYEKKCLKNGYFYTGWFCNGEPVLESIQ